MKPHVHYEAAFEDYLRRRQTPYVAVQEARQPLYRDRALKNFDFIVYSPRSANWLIDVKGRRCAAPAGRRPDCQNWVTRADLDALADWADVFGAEFRPLFVFAFWLDTAQPPVELCHEFRGQHYLFAAVPTDEYAPHARTRSARWGTVCLPRAAFTRLARPMDELL